MRAHSKFGFRSSVQINVEANACFLRFASV